MYRNREDAELLSDDEFERMGRKKKILIFVIIFAIIFAAAVLVYIFILKKSDNSINVQEVIQGNQADEKAVDETADSENTMDNGEAAVGETGEKMLPIGRSTVAGDNEFICEYSEINMPAMLQAGDYVDIRLSLADGRNYTVASEKRIMDFNKSGENSFLYLALCEEEIIILESAISDLKLFEGSRLYLAIGKQEEKARVNYPVNKKAERLLRDREGVNNLSGYNYEVKFDEALEQERLSKEKARGIKDQEWKEAASYWNDKE